MPPFRRVAAAPYPAYGVYRRSSLPRPGKRCAAGQSIGAIPAISPGGGCALPGLRGIQAIFASQARQALRRRAIYRRRTRHFAGWRLRLTRPGVRAACYSFTHLRD
ncbi:hypothetical protein ACYB83_07120, partial [Klebsiella pneumoniae]